MCEDFPAGDWLAVSTSVLDGWKSTQLARRVIDKYPTEQSQPGLHRTTQTRVSRRIKRIRTTDVSGHAVLYRPAVAWLTWHLSITSAQFIDTQMNKVGHMSPHGSIFLLSSTLRLCLHFLFQLSFLLPGLTIHQNHRMIQGRGEKKLCMRAEMREIQKQKNRNIHFTDPADYSC